MPLIDVNGTQLNDRIGGDDPQTVVMAHGLLMDLSMYDARRPALASRYRVIRYDHRVQGGSQATREGLDMDTLCEDAAALISALNAAPCHFVGMSMGGFMALRLAARHPDLLRSLTLIDSSAWTEPRRERLRFHAMRLGAWVFGLKPFIPAMLKLMFGTSTLRDPAKAGLIDHWRARLATRPRRVLHAVNAVVQRTDVTAAQIGSASCRERVCQYV